MARAVAALALTLALLGAGCSGLTGAPAESEPTLSPATVPAVSDRDDGQYVAPGVTDRRLVDPGALQRAHATALSNTSHTFRERVTRQYPNGTLLSRYTTTVQRNGSAVRYRYERSPSNGTVPLRVETWAEDRDVYTARTEGNATTYSVERAAATARRVPLGPDDYGASIGRVLGLLSLDVAGTERRDGRRTYRLVTTQSRDVPPLENVSFRGHVTPEGVLTDYRITYRVSRGGTPVDVTVRVTVDDLGTTVVERPPWYERAVTAADRAASRPPSGPG